MSVTYADIINVLQDNIDKQDVPGIIKNHIHPPPVDVALGKSRTGKLSKKWTYPNLSALRLKYRINREIDKAQKIKSQKKKQKLTNKLVPTVNHNIPDSSPAGKNSSIDDDDRDGGTGSNNKLLVDSPRLVDNINNKKGFSPKAGQP